MKFDDLKGEYLHLWETMEIKPAMARAAEAGMMKMLDGRTRYEAVEKATGVPWHVVGLIHLMEAGCRWGCHLHNGDPLDNRTVTVPKGRPATGKGPFTWEASAIDAVRYDKLDKVSSWDAARIAFALEGYNGWGYRRYHPEVHTPYLWSGSSHYAKGKYVEDGRWDPDCVSAQIGAMPVLRRLAERVPELGISASSKPIPAAVTPTSPESFPKAQPAPVREALGRSRTVLGALTVSGGLAIEQCGAALDVVVQTGLQAVAEVTKLEQLSKLAPGSKTLATTAVVLGIAIAVFARIDAARRGKVG